MNYSSKTPVKILRHLGLALFSFFGWLGTPFFGVGAVIVTFMPFAQARDFVREMGSQPIIWLVLAAITYLIALFFVYRQTLPSGLNPDVHILQDWLVLWLFPLLAWALRGQRDKAILMILALAAIGLIVRIAWYIEWESLSQFYLQRQGYGFNPVPMGLYSGIVILGLLVFGRRLMAYSKGNGVMRLVFVLLWGGALALTAVALITTQSRGAWLALVLSMLMMAVVVYLMSRSKGLRVRYYGIGLVVISVFLLPVIFLLHETIQKRLEVEADVYPAIISLDLEEVPYTSVGRRVHMWAHGLNEWSEKPVFGYGPGSAGKLLARDEQLAIHPNYHSIYIQVLVELGVVGGGFFLSTLLFLVIGFIGAYRRGEVMPDIFVFIVGAWVMILVSGLFSTRLFQSDGRFMMLMLTGVTLAYVLGWIRNAEDARQ